MDAVSSQLVCRYFIRALVRSCATPLCTSRRGTLYLCIFSVSYLPPWGDIYTYLRFYIIQVLHRNCHASPSQSALCFRWQPATLMVMYLCDAVILPPPSSLNVYSTRARHGCLPAPMLRIGKYISVPGRDYFEASWHKCTIQSCYKLDQVNAKWCR